MTPVPCLLSPLPAPCSLLHAFRLLRLFVAILPYAMRRLPYAVCRDTVLAACQPPSSGAHSKQTMSTLMEIEEAAAQLPSPDFVQLLEDLHDLATARVALGELAQDPTAIIAWDQLKAELDALHG